MPGWAGWFTQNCIGKLKFDHTNKWYIQNPTSHPQNDTCKLLWDFEIQMDHLILARRPELIIINKTKERDFAKLWTLLSQLTTVKLKESEIKDEYHELGKELQKLWNMKVTFIPVVIGALVTVIKGLIKDLEIWGDHSNYCINQNTENSPGNLRRIAVTQNPVKDHQIKPAIKNLNEY